MHYPTEDLLWLTTEADGRLIDAFRLGAVRDELQAEIERRRETRSGSDVGRADIEWTSRPT